MIESNRWTVWILAVVALAATILLGEIVARIVKASMSREGRSDVVREMARPVATFLFGSSVALGLLLAVASTSRHAFDAIPERASDALPDLLLAGLMLLAGYALAIGAAAALAQASVRASGVRHRSLERAARVTVLGTTVVLALSQIGVDTTLLGLALAMVVGGPTLAVVLLTALGGREVARDIAAGRAVRGHVKPGVRLTCDDVDGVVIAVHPVSVEVETDDGRTVHLPAHRLLETTYSVTPARVRG